MQHQHDHHTNDSSGSEPEAPRKPKQEQEEATTDVTEVAPGIVRTQLPINMPGLGHVNCYVLEDERGIAVVDPGLPGPESWDFLVDRLGRAGFTVDDVHTVVVTHSHPDHFGGAMRLRYESGADIVTHETFRTMFDRADLSSDEDSDALDLNSPDDRAAAMERHLAEPTPWGGRAAARRRSSSTASAPPGNRWRRRSPRRGRRGRSSMGRRSNWRAGSGWRCTPPATPTTTSACTTPSSAWCSPATTCFPRSRPTSAGWHPSPTRSALFFASLTRMAEMTDISIALPAHGHPFEDLRGRAGAIIEHHEERLDIIREALPELPNGTVDEFMRVLFRERSWGEMAESETYAHLEHLRESGELAKHFDGGLAHYTLVG